MCRNITIVNESFESSDIISDTPQTQEKSNMKHTHKLIFVQGGHQIGKISERHPVCEDAYFITENAFGVSDGVSGWNDYGFSSNEFSQQLMNNAKQIIEKRTEQVKNHEKHEKSWTTLKRVKTIFNKTRSVISLRNLSEKRENNLEKNFLKGAFGKITTLEKN